jgi:Tol biopolymer transport system component
MFGADRAAPNQFKPFVATRGSASADFGVPAPMTAIGMTPTDAGAAFDVPTWLSPDGSVLYFTTSRDGAPSFLHVYRSEAVGGVFQPPAPVTAINDDMAGFAVLSPDELTVYWSSSRALPSNQGKRDIFVAHRSSLATNFAAPPINVTEVNSAGTDTPTWLSPDGCRLYLASDRAGSTMNSTDVYVATRTP